jgi:protease I
MNLENAQIAVLADNQYQELELWYPLMRLREEAVKPDLAVADVQPSDLGAVVIPSGFGPEGMRKHKPMVDLVREVHEQGNLVAAICHAGCWPPPASRGWRLTCVPNIKDDVVNAGANYVDEPVMRDG